MKELLCGVILVFAVLFSPAAAQPVFSVPTVEAQEKANISGPAPTQAVSSDAAARAEGKVEIEAKFNWFDDASVAWPEAAGFLTCLRAGLAAQNRFGLFELIMYINSHEIPDLMMDDWHYEGALVLISNGMIIAKHNLLVDGSNPKEARAWTSKKVSPADEDFELLCGALTDTLIVFRLLTPPEPVQR